jgi:hypothetical protein
MTEEQRMEEGRRMFQIFAARMFEQRVLTAYREKVAKERQQRLLEELEEESRQDSQRKAKKAKEAQKRKDRAAKKKEAIAEEKARKDAEKAAEEQARLAEETRKAEEQRMKMEEKKKKKEAQKKAEEEERLRKEADRQRRIHEQKEKQAEQERKIREAKEKEKKAREDAKLKEKEAKDRKEREARDREKKEKDLKAKSDREAKEKQKQDDRAAQKATASIPITLPKRPAQHAVLPAAVPTAPAASFTSPKVPVATPALPKAPTPMRPRQPSQQESRTASSQAASQTGSTPSQNPSPHPITPIHTSPGPVGSMTRAGNSSAQGIPQETSQATSPLNTPAKALPTQPGAFNVPPMGMPYPPPGMPPMPPGFANRVPQDAAFGPFGGAFRAPGMMPMPPGISGPPGGRGFPMPHPHPPPGFSQPMDAQFPGISQAFTPSPPKENHSSHSRQPSYEQVVPLSTSQPIGRPAPIGRPSSVVHGQRQASGSSAAGRMIDFEDHHLGSSALLDDSDDALQDLGTAATRPSNAAPGPRLGFPPMPFGMDPMFPSGHNPWGPSGTAQAGLFSPPPPPGFGPGSVPVAWGPPAQPSSAFGAQGGLGRPNQPRSVAIRQMLCRTCKELAEDYKLADVKSEFGKDGYIALEAVKAQIDLLNSGEPVTESELLDICDTEGNHLNGGGNFDVRRDRMGNAVIRWVSGNGSLDAPLLQRAVGAGPGDIGSPSIGGGSFSGSSR